MDVKNKDLLRFLAQYRLRKIYFVVKEIPHSCGFLIRKPVA